MSDPLTRLLLATLQALTAALLRLLPLTRLALFPLAALLIGSRWQSVRPRSNLALTMVV